jgi:hypothetical protein
MKSIKIEKSNKTNYRQRCESCSKPTRLSEEDAYYLKNQGPLCEACYTYLSEKEVDNGHK